MRYFVFIILIVILLGALFGEWLRQDAGSILVSYQTLVLETSLWVGIFLFGLFLLLLFILYLIISTIWRLPIRLRHWQRREKINRTLTELKGGILTLVKGDLTQAFRSLHNSKQPETRLIAANAALSLGNYDQAMQLLTKIEQSPHSKEIAYSIALMKIRIYLAQRQYQQVLAIINLIAQDKREQAALNPLLREAYIQTGQWQQLIQPSFQKHASKQQLLENYKLYFNNESRLDALHACWHSLSSNHKKDPSLLSCYALNLAKRGDYNQAETLLAAALQKNYDVQLVDAYKEVKSPQPAKQLHLLEKLLEKGKEDKNILAALASIAVRCQLTSKAKDYYEKLTTNYQAEPGDSYAYVELLNQSSNTNDKKKATKILHRLVSSNLVASNS